MNNFLPTFLEESFDFGDELTPEHIDERPNVPSALGYFAVFSASTSEKSLTIANDVADEDSAVFLAKARARKQEADIHLYGYSDSVYVLYPDGKTKRVYSGRTDD